MYRSFRRLLPLRQQRYIRYLLAAVIVTSMALTPVSAVSAAEDFALPNGHFYTQTGGQQGAGFEVRDGDADSNGRAMRFWSDFQRLGGVDVLGYPISRVYRDADGFYYQLFQRALLQWHAELNSAVFANLLDIMSAQGSDDFLRTFSIPSPVPNDGSNGDFAVAMTTRLGWLSEPHIRDFYLGQGGQAQSAIERFGLPTSEPVRSGPFIIQRFQRIALQVWLDHVPGMPAQGSVVPVLAGDLFRHEAISNGIGLSDARFVPQSTVSGVSVTVPDVPNLVDDGLKGALDLLAAVPEGREVSAALVSPGVRVGFEDVPAIALFSATALTVAIDNSWRNTDPKTLATVLAHEGSHLADFLSGVEMNSPVGCYRTEYVAFQRQARVWQAFHGSAGKPNPTNALEVELNTILSEITTNPEGFSGSVVRTYRSECEQ